MKSKDQILLEEAYKQSFLKENDSGSDSEKVFTKLKEIRAICKKYSKTPGPHPFKATLRELQRIFEIWGMDE